jgi:hypothetical protein
MILNENGHAELTITRDYDDDNLTVEIFFYQNDEGRLAFRFCLGVSEIILKPDSILFCDEKAPYISYSAYGISRDEVLREVQRNHYGTYDGVRFSPIKGEVSL